MKNIEYDKLKLENVLPHDKPMILINKILDYDKNNLSATCEVTISPKSIFYDKEIKGISSLVGIEYMAQTIGVYAFFKNDMNTPKIGYLLGSRSFNSNIEYFEYGKN